MPLFGDKRRFTRTNVEQAPAAAGVYALFGDDGVAYYGSACEGETIRDRLFAHLGGRELPGGDGVQQFSFEVTRFALSRERALLEEHRRLSRHLPKYNQTRPRRPARAL